MCNCEVHLSDWKILASLSSSTLPMAQNGSVTRNTDLNENEKFVFKNFNNRYELANGTVAEGKRNTEAKRYLSIQHNVSALNV